MQDITSQSNAKIKYIRSLAQKKSRAEHREYTVEGVKSVRDALSSDREVTAFYASKSFTENEEFDYPENIPVYRVEDAVFEKLCDTKTPQGILAVIKMTDTRFELDKEKFYIYCDRLQDPGNLGTVIRTADAAGAGGVLLSEGCADLYSPKTVRASMGSFFNVNVMTDVSAKTLEECAVAGFAIYGGSLGADSIPYTKADFTKPCVIVIGNEANGISGEVLRLCQSVKIPIMGKAESLNAGVAAAVLMYETVRQRA